MPPPPGGPAGGGTVEQVNAWGSYESTATKQARKLHHRRHHGKQEQQQHQDLRQRGGRRNSRTVNHSFHGTTFYDLEIHSTTDKDTNRRGGGGGGGGGGWRKKDQNHHRLYSSHKNLLNVSRHGGTGNISNIPVSLSLHGVGGARASGNRVVSTSRRGGGLGGGVSNVGSADSAASDPAASAESVSGSTPVPQPGDTPASSSRTPSSSQSPPGFFETIVTEKRRRTSTTLQTPDEDPTTSTPTKTPAAAAAVAKTDEVDKTETERYDDDTEKQIDYDDIGVLDDEDLFADVRETFPIFFEDPICATAEKTDDRNTSNSSNCINWIWSLLMSINATMPWQYDSYYNSKTIKYVGMCLRGIGQVYFMNNPVSGLLILAGLFIQSTRVAVHGIIALLVGTTIALLLRFDTGLARSGLFGYNSVLVGLAIATFDSTTQDVHKGYNAATIICTIVFASSSSIVFVMLGKLLAPYKSPPLTLPFNIATIFFLLSSANMSRVDLEPVRIPALPDYESPQFEGISATAFFAGTIRGIGQVFLADNIVAGILVLLGLAVCSRISAIAAYLGSVLGAATALAIGVPGTAVEQGMFGFNASLSVTAMFMFYTPSFGAAVMATMAGIMTVLTQAALATMLQPLGLPVMTLPFCVVGLLFILIQGTTTIVIPVPLSSMTIPEDHYRVVKMLEDGFAFLKECIADPIDAPRKRMSTKARSKKMARSLTRLSSILSDVGNDDFDLEKMLKKKQATLFGKTKDHDIDTKISALSLFKKLDRKDMGVLPIEGVVKILKEAGLTDSEGISFARLMLHTIDLDNSSTIDEHEFVAFAVVGKSVDTIRHKLFKFFEFVDEDGNGKVDLDEINHALEYLGQPTLTDEESENLFKITQWDDDGIDLIELLNVVTLAKVSSLVDVYHRGRRTLHGSMHGSSRKIISTFKEDEAVPCSAV